MDDDAENVFATSTIDRYAAIPPILGNMCLAKFAVNYNDSSKSWIHRNAGNRC